MLDINSPQYLKGKLGEDFVAEWFQKNRSDSEVVRHPFPFKSGAATWDFLKTDAITEIRSLIEVKTYKNYWDSLNKVDFFFMKRKDIVLYRKDYQARRKADDIDGAFVFFVCAELKTVFSVEVEELFKKKIIQRGCIFKTMRDEEGNILWQIPIPNLERVTRIPNELCEKILAIEISPQKVYDSDDNSDIEEEDWDDDEDEEEDWDDEDTEDAKETEEKILDKQNETSGGQEKPNPPEENLTEEKSTSEEKFTLVALERAERLVNYLVEFEKKFNLIANIPREEIIDYFLNTFMSTYEDGTDSNWAALDDLVVPLKTEEVLLLYETSGEQTDTAKFSVTFESLKGTVESGRDWFSCWDLPLMKFINLKLKQIEKNGGQEKEKPSEEKPPENETPPATPKDFTKAQADELVAKLIDFEKIFKDCNISRRQALESLVNGGQENCVDIAKSRVIKLNLEQIIAINEKDNANVSLSTECFNFLAKGDIETVKSKYTWNVDFERYIDAKMK